MTSESRLTLNDTLRELSRLGEAQVPGLSARIDRLTVWAVAVGAELGISEDDLFAWRFWLVVGEVGQVIDLTQTLSKEGAWPNPAVTREDDYQFASILAEASERAFLAGLRGEQALRSVLRECDRLVPEAPKQAYARIALQISPLELPDQSS